MDAMVTRDLFDPAHDGALPPVAPGFTTVFEDWLAHRLSAGTLRQPSSVAVYRSMWGALAAWSGARGLRSPQQLDAGLLQDYLLSRPGGQGADLLGPRHAWRLLRLVDDVLAHAARPQPAGVPPTSASRAATGARSRSPVTPRPGGVTAAPPGTGAAPDTGHNTAAQELLQATPAWRHANAAHRTPLPAHLDGAQARALVGWLLAAPPPGTAWQALRDRAAVALQLGAGLTPADVRAVQLSGVVSAGGRAAGVPWKLRLPAHGAVPEREAPVAPWAGRLLRRWLDVRSALAIAGPMLFPATRAGRPWGKVAQYTAARGVLAAAGLPDQAGGSFLLRHTFALRQLRRGASAEQVAGWLGLADAAALARHRRLLIGPAAVV